MSNYFVGSNIGLLMVLFLLSGCSIKYSDYVRPKFACTGDTVLGSAYSETSKDFRLILSTNSGTRIYNEKKHLHDYDHQIAAGDLPIKMRIQRNGNVYVDDQDIGVYSIDNPRWTDTMRATRAIFQTECHVGPVLSTGPNPGSVLYQVDLTLVGFTFDLSSTFGSRMLVSRIKNYGVEEIEYEGTTLPIRQEITIPEFQPWVIPWMDLYFKLTNPVFFPSAGKITDLSGNAPNKEFCDKAKQIALDSLDEDAIADAQALSLYVRCQP